jgi:hypothetical protein
LQFGVLELGVLELGVLELGILQHLIHGFPLSGPESGHTERQSTRMRGPTRPFSFIRTLTVGFGVTPNLLTLPSRNFQETKALAGLGYLTLTAGGEFHPALRTSAARDERPEKNYDQGRLRQQAPSHGESACPHDQIDDLGRPNRRATRAFGVPDSQPANPTPVCSRGKS